MLNLRTVGQRRESLMAEIADGAGGYLGISNWSGQDVPAMWRKVESQQTDNHWKIVAGWQKTCELTSTHMSRVKQYRESLVAAWPPSKSEAARAYVAQLDQLIDKLQETYDAASANYTALSGATSALSTSRSQLQRLNEEYTAKAAEKQLYDEQAASLRQAGFTGVHGKPPVTDAELEQLNNRARTIMYSLSGELVQAQAQIRQPPPPKPGNIENGAGTEVYGGGSGPPMIPPIMPVPVATSGSGWSSERASAGTRLPFPAPTAPVAGPVLGNAGPVLGSAGTLAPHPSASPLPPTPTAPPTGGGGGFSPTLPPGPGLPGRSGGLGRPLAGSPTLPPSPLGKGLGGAPGFGLGEAVGPPRPLPPGGLIGGSAGPGLGQPAAGGAKARRINPVGGVIGGGGAGTAPAGSAGQRPGPGSGRAPMGAGGQAFGGMPSDRSVSRTDKEQGGRRWDPDNPWETEEGVPPVVLPPDDPGRIDPGPAIGLDR
jgi:hypothetical protein